MTKVMARSAAEFFKLAHNNQVIKRVSGVATVEQKDDMVKSIKSQLLEQGAQESDIKITDDKISIGHQFWLLPKMRAEEQGLLIIRSKDYVFHAERGPIYGDKVGCTVVDGVLTKKYDNGMIVTFEIV